MARLGRAQPFAPQFTRPPAIRIDPYDHEEPVVVTLSGGASDNAPETTPVAMTGGQA